MMLTKWITELHDCRTRNSLGSKAVSYQIEQHRFRVAQFNPCLSTCLSYSLSFSVGTRDDPCTPGLCQVNSQEIRILRDLLFQPWLSGQYWKSLTKATLKTEQGIKIV